MTAWRRLLALRRGRVSLALVGATLLVALVGPWLLPADALMLDPLHELAAPSRALWFGRAENGVPLGAALMVGARATLWIAVVATLLCAVAGTAAGTACAALGGRLDALMVRGFDVVGAFPGILLAVYLAAVLPPSPWTVVGALSATGWIGFARVARTGVQAALAREHVVAARALGVAPAALLWRHVLPDALAPLVVQGSFSLSAMVLAEASLSFLGLGSKPGTPSWGALMDEGVGALFVAPHLALFPGLCIATTVLAFHLLGDSLLVALDARSAQRNP